MKVMTIIFYLEDKQVFCATNSSECCTQWGDTLEKFCIMLFESSPVLSCGLCTTFLLGLHCPQRDIPLLLLCFRLFIFHHVTSFVVVTVVEKK